MIMSSFFGGSHVDGLRTLAVAFSINHRPSCFLPLGPQPLHRFKPSPCNDLTRLCLRAIVARFAPLQPKGKDT